MPQPKYKRVLLKLSGETFLGDRKFGIDPKFALWLAREISSVLVNGQQLTIVVGGGNIFRGSAAEENGLERTTGDYIGMLATIMNSLVLQAALEKVQVPSRVLTAIEVKDVAEPYIKGRAKKHLEKGRVVIFAGGTGNPFFTTDTTAALRALENKCSIILKGTKVDGVYDKDPNTHNGGKKFDKLSFKDALTNKDIKVLDNSAISLCMDHNIPILVFNLHIEGNIAKAVKGEKIGTLIS